MGREARCHARWGARSGEVTVLIEPPELIARGAFRARARLDALGEIRVEGGTLRCSAAGEQIELALGPLAARWATALVAPPPSLAKKLGLKSTTRVQVEGEVDDDALAAALAEAKPASGAADTDVIVARIDEAAALASVLKAHARALARGVPLWVVYIKGKDGPLGESAIRTILRDRGFIDVKVASVSTRLTALQFVRRAKKAKGLHDS
jgi:hypothetical protein